MVSNRTSIALPVPTQRVRVMFPLPLGPFDYRVEPGMRVFVGDIVVAPINGRKQIGVVWDDLCDETFPEFRLKHVTTVVDEFRIGETLRRFVDWVGAYTLSPRGEVLAMVLRAHALSPDRPLVGLERAVPEPNPPARLTKARARVLACIGNRIIPARALARSSNVSEQVLRGMIRVGLLVSAQMRRSPRPAASLPSRTSPNLSPEQDAAAAVLRAAALMRRFSVTLLRGATGSGKTEVYFEAIRASVDQGRQALILLPEIALSTQWLRRFEQRFGIAPALWHSDLGPGIRRDTWRSVARGEVAVVVGARSALFLSFPDLGLIVVDEEHDTAFKQEGGVSYHARDMAVVRGRLCDATIILVSATPSLESLMNVSAGRYQQLDLPQRFGGAALPQVIALDLRLHPPARGSFLSPILLDEIKRTLARREQTLLFLNRRGYAPLTLCSSCGHRIQCLNCTAWLVEHRLRRVLMCHHCGYAQPVPMCCPACAAESSLTAVGPGVERITEEVAALFPNARLLIMASDTLPNSNAAAAAAAAVERREVDLIIGTQIAAKGWHFPYLTLVGVVDADLGLAGGDLRAAERTMQLLHQVAGRAGREQAVGLVLLQTYQPGHPVIESLVAGDLDRFMREEAAQRRLGNWPPFGRLVALIISACSAEDADAIARLFARFAPRSEGVIVLGPAPAPLAILRGRHRRRLLLRTTRNVVVQPLMREWLARVVVPRHVRVDVDVDPVSFL